MELYAHQKRFLEKNPDRALLCHGTGTGKTITAIRWGDLKSIEKEKILVVCPKSLKENWIRNIRTHSKAERVIWSVLTKEEFRRDHKELPYYGIVIVDEAHYFSGIKSQMTKALATFCKDNEIQYRLLLTATPYLSTPWNIYTLARHLGHAWSYPEFEWKFFYKIRMGMRSIPVIKEGMEGEIAELVAKIGDVVRLDECIDVPPQIFETERLELTSAQQKRIKKINEINPIVRFTYTHEVENGVLKSDGFTEDEFFDNNKTDRIIELCKEVDKVAVVCRYNLQIDALKAEIEKSVPGKAVHVIRGDVKDRQAVVDDIERADRAIVLIQGACSEGYELPSVGLIVFASLDFSYKNYVQMCGRFLRINKPKKNVYIHLVIDGGVDEAVMEAMEKKQDFAIEIYARNKVI